MGNNTPEKTRFSLVFFGCKKLLLFLCNITRSEERMII